MENLNIKFSLLISTRNRLEDLKYTLHKINYIISKNDVECIVYDDGSNDGTQEYIKNNYPKIIVYRNEYSKGYLYCRNKMLNQTIAQYAISLDDDANFLSQNSLEEIENYFAKKPNCGLIGFRIFWSKQEPTSITTNDVPRRVKGFVGCGHAWRLSAWNKIPNYPEWFVFYGEEEFASYQLFKINQEVHYLPSILAHHRVNLLERKKFFDYQLRQRRSLRSGWYLMFLFHPWHYLPKQLAYSLWIQVKNKVFKGDIKATLGILQAIGDLLLNFPKLLLQNNRLSKTEYLKYKNLPQTILFWKPEDEK